MALFWRGFCSSALWLFAFVVVLLLPFFPIHLRFLPKTDGYLDGTGDMDGFRMLAVD